MDLIASFSSQRINTFQFFTLHGFIGSRDLIFLFDTGAACPVVGVNNLFRNTEDTSSTKRMSFEVLLRGELSAQAIPPRPMKAANSQKVMTYPCVCHNVSIENTARRDFYFDISFDEISIPLLGSSFIDDCAYNHAINGNLNITGMKDKTGADYYVKSNVLDFDAVVAKFAYED